MRPHEDYWHTAKLVALIIAICLWLILFNMSKFQQMPTGKVLELARCGNGVIESDIGEECEYNNDSFCPGRCKEDCTCAYCGNNVLDRKEDCDGAWDFACPGQCQSNCKCPPPESRVLTSKYRQSFFYDVVPAEKQYILSSNYPALALQSIAISSSVQLENVRLYIDWNISRPANVTKPADFVYQYINVGAQNSSHLQYFKAEFDFKVPKAWYGQNGLNSSTTKLNRYAESWTALNTKFSSEDSQYLYYTATSPGLSLFAISADKFEEPKPIVPVCGNGILETGETPETCCADAPCIYANETCKNNRCVFVARCGNQICEQTEDAKSCPTDCGALVLFFPQFLAIFVTLLLVSALTISGHLRQRRIHKTRKKRKEPAMPALSSEEEQVEEYIKTHLKKGFSEHQIRSMLMKQGWESDFIDEMLLESKSKVE